MLMITKRWKEENEMASRVEVRDISVGRYKLDDRKLEKSRIIGQDMLEKVCQPNVTGRKDNFEHTLQQALPVVLTDVPRCTPSEKFLRSVLLV